MPGPVVTYPGVTGVKQIEGSNPVGISPGQFVLLAYVGSTASETGTLTIGDGVNANITFPNCFRQYDDVVTAGGNKYRTIRLWDRRYRLMMGFAVQGHWNQVDDRKKLIPWTVASPYQLAVMLATAMGETLTPTLLSPEAILDIDLPGGLAQPADPGLGIPAPGPRDTVIRPGGEFYRCGTNAPVSNTNPTVYWNGMPAAVAMQALCETYGRIFCPDPTTASTSTIWPIGSGTAIPAGGVQPADGTSITADPKPARVDVICSPTRYQPRLRMRPVMLEWDGTWVTPERCSYAPARAGQKMKCVASLKTGFVAASTYALTVNTVLFSTVNPANAGLMAGNLAGAIAAAIAGGNPLLAGLTATAVGSTVEVAHTSDGVEFEITTAGSSGGLAGNWRVDCTVGPVTGPRNGQPVYEITYAGAWAVGKTLSVTIDGNLFTSDNTLATKNAALLDLVTQVNASGLSVVAEWAPDRLLVTGNAPGTPITVAAAAGGGGITVTNVNVAGTTFTPKGWEKAGWPSPGLGYLSVATARLSLDAAKRLTAEHWCRTYQVVTDNPDPFDQDGFGKAIPVPGYNVAGPVTGTVDNRHRIVMQSTRPEPVTPAPDAINVFDVRTAQPFALETYNGYATGKPNAAFGSVHPSLISDGLVWRGGTYLGNTPPRQRLPFGFRIIDPLNQVIQFDRPLFRILGTAAGTAYLPAELVIECGAIVLRPGDSSPDSYVVSVFPGGPGPTVTRVFADVEDEAVGTYDAYHRVTGWRYLNQEAGERAQTYANGVAATYQNASGQNRRYSGLLNIPTSGKTRVVNWALAGDTCETAVGVNCEISRHILPLAARRRDESLSPDAVRAAQNLDTDFKRAAGFANAMKWFNTNVRGFFTQ